MPTPGFLSAAHSLNSQSGGGTSLTDGVDITVRLQLTTLVGRFICVSEQGKLSVDGVQSMQLSRGDALVQARDK